MFAEKRADFIELLGPAYMDRLEKVEPTADVPSLARQRARAERPDVVKLVDDMILDFWRKMPAKGYEEVEHLSKRVVGKTFRTFSVGREELHIELHT